jgi:hypothetical protein
MTKVSLAILVATAAVVALAVALTKVRVENSFVENAHAFPTMAAAQTITEARAVAIAKQRLGSLAAKAKSIRSERQMVNDEPNVRPFAAWIITFTAVPFPASAGSRAPQAGTTDLHAVIDSDTGTYMGMSTDAEVVLPVSN